MLFLLYGKDTYRRDERLREIREAYREKHPNALGETVIDGDKPEALAEFEGALAQAGGLFEQKSLVIARRLLTNTGEEAATVCTEQNVAQRDDVNVVLVEDEDKHKLRGATMEEFKLLSEQELSKWIARYVREKGPKSGPTRIAKRAAALLEALGPNLIRIVCELEKALAYAAGEEVLREEHVAALLNTPDEETVFPVSDGICSRRPLLALAAITRLTAEGQDMNGLINYAIQESRQLIRAHAALSEEFTDDPLRLFNVKPFVWRKRTSQARAWSKEEILKLSKRIADLEVAWKTGANKRLALEAFILAAAPETAAGRSRV